MASFLDDYEPVENRIREFWRDHPAGRIITELLRHDDGDYIVSASVYRGDELRDHPPAATGLAHDSVSQLPQHMKASALETCETSAIGRALANLGYAPKGQRPSREEMTKTAGGDSTPATVYGEGTAPEGASPAPKSSPAVAPGTPPAGEDHTHDFYQHPTNERREVCACGITRKRGV